jgi:hypothetical protein
MEDDDRFSLWMLTFFHGDNPPGESGSYLCSDGEQTFFAEYNSELDKWWRWQPGTSIPTNAFVVKAWAELPDAGEVLLDLGGDCATTRMD